MKRLYSIITIFALFGGALFAHEGHEQNEGATDTITVENDPNAPLTAIPVDGLDYTFHFYTADGKLYEGYTDLFIALKDKSGNFVENFSVGNFAPVMDMGTMSHSTPIGKVEKIEGQPVYKTWFACLMDGDWELSFDYTIEGISGKITGSAFSVSEVPAGQKWIQSFNSKYYAVIACPQSYKAGNQVLQAYINRNIAGMEPYQIVEGGYEIVATAQSGATVLPATTLLWNAGKGIYEGNVNFPAEGLWTIFFKVLDAGTDALVAGESGTNTPLTLNIRDKGLFLINIKAVSGEAVARKVIVK